MKKFSLILALVIVLGFVGCSLDKPGVTGGDTPPVVVAPNSTNANWTTNIVESFVSFSSNFVQNWSTNYMYNAHWTDHRTTISYKIWDFFGETNYVATVSNTFDIFDENSVYVSSFTTNVETGTTNLLWFISQDTNYWKTETVHVW